MRSNKERRKVNLHFTSHKKAAAAAVSTAAVLFFAATGAAQTGKDAPSLSIFRKGVGIVSMEADKTTTHAIGDLSIDLITGDFDADGRLDTGTFNRSFKLWTIRLSGDGSTLALSFPQNKWQKVSGQSVVVPADFDGDGKTDLALWHDGSWQVRSSSTGKTMNLMEFGVKGDVPVPADYDGDGKADLAVFRPSENRWYILRNETGTVDKVDFGEAFVDLLPADYTGDGKADPAFYRNGIWHIFDSETGVEETFKFGFEDAAPIPGDFNRDGQTDFAVFRKGTWYVYDGDRFVSYKFGADEDVPLSDVPVRQSMTGL